jgi:Zn-dependent peptidase ImmA (M78 family)
MKLPKRVKVLTRWYEIKIDNKMEAFGECHYKERIIKVNVKKCEKKDVVRQTFWHEVGHAWCWESGISNNTNSTTEEMLVESFAAVLIDMTGGVYKQKR